MNSPKLKALYSTTRSLIRLILKRFSSHRITSSAGQIAFFFILSFIPFLSIINSVFANIGINDRSILERFAELFPPETNELVTKYIEYIYNTADFGIISVGSVVSVYSASKLIRSLSENFDMSLGIINGYGFIKSFLSYYLLTAASIASIILLIIILLISRKLTMFLQIDSFFITKIIDFKPIVSLLVMFIVLLLAYKQLPHRKMKFSEALPGSIASSIVLASLNAVFSLYIKYFLNGSLILGGIGSIIILLLYVYFCGIIILLGCEINAVFIEKKNSSSI